ncbi:NADPH-dependent 2,4-dienoyl-CoA reductase/sulfur reductase-like enzyme [Lipingzhangella halophila]|uniref:NADPH-dependent 2,4-dienoyl-CoA reductase/sulfur reductase-like enzyme n=1 Tax=Lipingzhangella halophila TaxID=1783352 RepID=A0A7W7RFS3_9ACTN|nr:FAD-dependent oxidoreductase [Lipingzhangella halophila]MBB4931150.1 NADPH-dependent 2,4-dienoyl-CoA reductase/sulfur reductase-like enzyme [Lipingzhangella halophila]
MRRIAIVGGSLAGVHAAEALRQQGFEGDVTLISAENELPYDRPPLSKEALLSGVAMEKLSLRAPEWYADNAITTRLGNAAVQLDTERRTVLLDDGTAVDYDGLVIATGARARRLPSTRNAPPVQVLRSIEDSLRLRERLRPGQHLVLIGAGFIGLEIAATARQMDLDVTVVEVGRAPLSRALGDEVGDWFRALHARHGVEIVCTCTVETIERRGDGAVLTLSNGRVLNADVVVAGVGASPVTEWLDGSGVQTANGVVCHSDLSTSVPGVVAAGDVARWYNPLFDEEIRVEHWTNAVEQGRRAAHTLLGNGEAFGAVPYFWTDQYEARMRFVGRASAATEVAVKELNDDRLVALYGRDGLVRGAVCVNVPRELARYRTAIRDQVLWDDIAQAQSAIGG